MLNVSVSEARGKFTEILDRVHRGKERIAVGDEGEPLAVLVPVEDLKRLENQAEEALRESEARLQAILDNSPAAIYLKDLEGRFITVGKTALAWYGRKAEDVLGRTSHDLVPKEKAEAYALLDRDVIQTRRAVTLEEEDVLHDGETHTIVVTKFPVFGPDGTLMAIGGVDFDITERKRAEAALLQARGELERRVEERTADLRRANEALTKEIAERTRTERALRESETRFRDFAETASDWFWETDMEQRFTYYSGSGPLDNVLGLKNPNSIIGKTRHEVWRSREGPNPIDTIADYMARGAAFSRLEISHRDPECGLVHISLSGKPVTDDGGNVVAYRGTGRDITERKRAEEEARDSRDRIRLIADSLPVFIGYFDREQRFRFVNKTAQEWFARPLEEILGRTIREIIGPEAHDRLSANLEGALAGKEQRFEKIRTFPDGKPRVVELSYVPHVDEHGKVQGCFALVHDITERKHSEEVLRESEATLRAFIDHFPGEIFVKDREGRYLLIDQEYKRRYGMTLKHAKGKMIVDFFPQEVVDPNTAAFRQVIEAGKVVAIEEQLHYGGVDHTNLLVLFPIQDRAGYVIAVGGMGTDITERKRTEEALRESEARLSKATEMAKIGYWVWDEIKDKAIYCSEELAKMYGVASGEDLAAILCSHAADLEWVHPEDREYFNQAVEKSNAAKSGYDIEYRIINSAGEIRHLHVIEEPAVDQHGEIIRSNGIAHDITDQKRVEEEIRKLNAELEQRVEERTAELRAAQAELLRQARLATLGQLTATVSHELRNPLGVIRTSAFVVRDGLKEEAPRARRALERIERGVIRCDRIIDEMLDFTRISELEFETTPIDTWLAGVLEEQVVPREVTVHNEFALPGVGVGLDRDRLRRAVINVFDNACQAMIAGASERSESGEHRLTVRTGAAAGRIELVFEDTGPGILPDVLPRVFEPLFSTKGFGVGLGLSVVHQIMEQHGGGIEIENREGGGARVRLWLPGDEPGT